jgi:sugar phosphate isomerase/epimerase
LEPPAESSRAANQEENMDAPWQRYLQLGVEQFLLYPELMNGDGPIVETAKRIASDPFFEVLEVGLINDPKAIEELKTLTLETRLSYGMCAQPGLLVTGGNLASLDEEIRRKSVECVKASIDRAYALGAKLMAFMDGKNSYPGKDKEEQAKKQFIRSALELCGYAKQKARDYLLFLSVEVFDREVEKRSLLGPASLVAEVASEIRRSTENFGVTVNLSHIPLLGESPREALVPVGDYVAHLHAGNCYMSDKTHPAYGDTHPPFGYPGSKNGVAQLVEFLRVAFEIGFFNKRAPTGRPVLTFDVKPLPGGDANHVIAGIKRSWGEAWAQLSV